MRFKSKFEDEVDDGWIENNLSALSAEGHEMAIG